MMKINSKYKYIIDSKNRKVILVLAEDEKGNTKDWKEKAKEIGVSDVETAYSGSVSRKKRGSRGFVPLVDIRNKEANKLFESYDYLQVSIFEDTILVEGYEEINPNTTTLFKRDSKNNNVKDIQDIVPVKPKFNCLFIREQIEKQLSFDDLLDGFITKEIPEPYKFTKPLKEAIKNLPIALKIASLFSGAGMMDKAFQDEGYDITFALEKEVDAVESYKHNIGDHVVCQDILETDMSIMGDAPIILGGPPCQGFSSANRRTNYLDNPKNKLVREYINAVKSNKHCKVFILENVPQLLSAGEGAFKNEILRELNDFEITFGVLKATDFDCAQDRSRAFMIGSKIGRIELPKPTTYPQKYKTVEQAFEGLTDDIPNQLDYSKAKPLTIERMKCIRPGENWRALPDHLKTAKMFKGDTHSSIYRRLKLGDPAITITNARKSNILHPTKNRIISVREAARLFGLQDSFLFKGSLSAKQQQVANGVPYQISKAIAKVVKKAIEKFNTFCQADNPIKSI